MISNIQKDYRDILHDLLYLKMFIIYEFIEGKLKGKTLKKVIFSAEMLNEEEYKLFNEKRAGLPVEIPESWFSTPGLLMLELGLEKLSSFLYNGTFSIEDIYKVLFSSYYIKDGKVVTGNN